MKTQNFNIWHGINMRKVIEEFSKLSVDKMSQEMSDVTFMYKDTVVPKTHYKRYLDEIVEEHLDEAIKLSLLDVYVKGIKRIIDDSPKMFFQALLCVDKKVNPCNMRPIELRALDNCYDKFINNGNKNYSDTEIAKLFDEIIKSTSPKISKIIITTEEL